MEKERINPQIISFLKEFCIKYKIKNAGLDNIKLDTSIDLDLNIFDIDMDYLLLEYTERFKIDSSQFDWDKYGYPSDSFVVGILRTMFGFKNRKINKMLAYVYKPKIRMDKLQEAFNRKVLI